MANNESNLQTDPTRSIPNVNTKTEVIQPTPSGKEVRTDKKDLKPKTETTLGVTNNSLGSRMRRNTNLW